MRRALPYVLLVAILAASGCGPKPGPKIAFRPRFYHRLVSLSPSTSEIIAGNADTTKMVGRTSACDYPPAMMKPIPIVSGVTPDYEKIASVHPDLILCDGSLYSKEQIDKLKGISGADVFVVDGDTVDAYNTNLYQLGSMLAEEMRFAGYVDRILAEKNDAIAGKLPSTPKVAVILPSPDGHDWIDGTESFVADVVKIGGGTPVGPKGNKFVELNPETLVSMNPDVIICSGSKSDFSGVTAMLKDPRFQTVSAIKNGRVKVMDGEVLERRGERVDTLIQKVHQCLAEALTGK